MSKKELITVTKAEMAFLIIGWGLIFSAIVYLLMNDAMWVFSDIVKVLGVLIGVLAFIASPFVLAYLFALTVAVISGTYQWIKAGRDE
jgi:hypothetical protein